MGQPINWATVAAYARGIWSAAGPLLGVFVGAYVANRNQRRQWVADKKHEEYRELLEALNKALTMYTNAGINQPNLREWFVAHPEIFFSVTETFGTRMLIAPALIKMRAGDRFLRLTTDSLENKEEFNIIDPIHSLIEEVRNAAMKDIGV